MVNNTAERDNEKMAGWVAHYRARPRQPSFPLPVGGKGKVLLRRTHSPDRITVAADDVVHALAVRAEIEVPRVERDVRAERTRQVVAVAPTEVERTAPTVAGGG